MQSIKKQNINQKVLSYIDSSQEYLLNEIYEEMATEFQPKLRYWGSSTFMANEDDMQSLFNDAFIGTLDVITRDGGDFVKLFSRQINCDYKDLIRKLMTRRKYELYHIDNGDPEAATFEPADEFNLEESIIAKKKADQRQLIDSLLSEADESTTAIVETFLSHPKPTATAIARELGVHHSKVTRALHRLAANFDTKQFGSHRDYLVAL